MLAWESKEFFKNRDVEWLGDAIERIGKSMTSHASKVTNLNFEPAPNGRFWFKNHKPWEFTMCYDYVERVRSITGKDRLKIMDFGCGISPFPQFLAERGHEVWGVDNGGWHRDIETDKIKEIYPDVEFRMTDLVDLEEYGFDVILSASVLEHIPEPALLEVFKIMRYLLEGGKMFHAVDYYFPEKNKSNHNFSTLCQAAGFSFESSICPGSRDFDFPTFRAKNEANFMYRDWEDSGVAQNVSRVGIGDDV